jgi:hypothetical protein
MKKILTVTLLLVSSFVFGQNNLHFGLKAGMNVSNLTNADFEDAKAKGLFGFNGGVYLNYTSGNFGIQPEILVSTQGAKLDSVSGKSTQWRLTYINVPVLAQFRSNMGLYAEIGPQVGFKISEDIGGQTIDNFVNNLDFSAAIGVGFRGKSGFGIGARYNVGISKIGNVPENVSDVNPDFKNGVFQASLYVPLTK